MTKQRREFGSVRRTAAGRYQARYTAPDGTPRKGPRTFETKRAAQDFLADVRSAIKGDGWRDPQQWCPTVADYFPTFQASRIGRGGGAIRPSTHALAADQFERYVHGPLGHKRLDQVKASDINRWYASLPDRPALRRQLYSLTKALFEQAIRDEYLATSNPCRIPRAGQNSPSSRPNFSFADVERVVARLDPQTRTLAAVAFGAHLRLGEVLALRWGSIDLSAGDVEVSRSVAEVGNAQVETSTKTNRVRQVKLPRVIASQLRSYALTRPRSADTRVFTRTDGSALRHFHVQRAWDSARREAGLPTIRFHDLRHVGLTMLAEGGMPLKSLMYRAGHSTVDAALVYQHRAAERDEVEAKALENQMAAHRRTATLTS